MVQPLIQSDSLLPVDNDKISDNYYPSVFFEVNTRKQVVFAQLHRI